MWYPLSELKSLGCDEFDRLTGVKYDGETADRYTYEYGANGEAAEVTDNELGRTTRTDYDLADRPYQTELVDNATGEVLYKTGLKYDKLNHLTMFSEQVDDETHKSEYTYDRDNRVTQITFDGGTHKVGYTYDELGRVVSRVAECGNDDGKVTSTYSYMAGSYGTNSTTPLVASITQKGVNFTYEYDSRGNIISETRGNVEGGYLTTSYVYDVLGQLVRVNDPHENATWVYNYDRGGNITSKVRYAYTTGSLGTALENIPYVYGDSNWKDKLTRFNDRSFTYDDIGNPTNDGIWAYEWEAGRKLKAMSAEGTALTFKYDHNGLRTQKVVQQDWYPVTTNYALHGKLITHMTVDYTDWDEVARQDVLHFFYDTQSRPAKVRFNGTMYTYVHNVQDDIIGILDSEGNLVVEYKYDAWGRLLSTTGSMATILGKRNPFRYRSYIYDEETGFYYNLSRYYSSDTGRMVSPDLYSIPTESLNTLTDKNYFAYTDNNPIMRVDKDGLFWDTFFDIVSVAQSVVAVIATPADPIAWISLAADVASLAVPGVTGGGNLVRAITKSDDVVDAAKSIYKAADKASDLRKATGSYDILYASGKHYVGKGGYKRMITSASKKRIYNGATDKVVSVTWKRANSQRAAFIDEYLKMAEYTKVLDQKVLYNRIWSPGRKYYNAAVR